MYTIGHSSHNIDYFNELLNVVGVNCVVDVRSVPASAYNPQYNQNTLKHYLKSNGKHYLDFSNEFGARRKELDVYDYNEKVNFDKVRSTKLFLEGVNRLKIGLEKNLTIALMCSESNPLECHRFSMISYALVNDGISVKHILKDKNVIANSELENQLLKKFEKKLPKPDIFNSNVTLEEQIKVAYELVNQEIGYNRSLNVQLIESND